MSRFNITHCVYLVSGVGITVKCPIDNRPAAQASRGCGTAIAAASINIDRDFPMTSKSYWPSWDVVRQTMVRLVRDPAEFFQSETKCLKFIRVHILYVHIHRTKSRNNDRTPNHPIGRNDGVSGRQMIYCLRPVR